MGDHASLFEVVPSANRGLESNIGRMYPTWTEGIPFNRYRFDLEFKHPTLFAQSGFPQSTVFFQKVHSFVFADGEPFSWSRFLWILMKNGLVSAIL